MGTEAPLAVARFPRVRTLLGVVRLRPFDTTTEEGRSRERYRRAALTAIATGGARVVSIATVLVSAPLALDYLGRERYGVWVTIASFALLLSAADAGLGNGLLTALARAVGLGDDAAASRYVSSAFAMLAGISLAGGAAFAAGYSFIPWDTVYNLRSGAGASEAGVATAVFVTYFLLSLPLAVVDRTQLGHQEGFVTGLTQLAGNVAALGAVVAALLLHARLPWIMVAYFGPVLLGSLLNGVLLFGLRRPWLLPRARNVTSVATREMLQLGAMFLLLQLSVALAFGSDNIIVAHVLGTDRVPDYFVPMRLFAIVPMVLVIAFNPLWPAYGEAASRGDVPWIRKTLLRSVGLAVGATTAVSLLLIVLGKWIVHVWVGPSIDPSYALLLGFGAWAVATSAGNAIAMLLNGVGVIKLQTILVLAMGLCSIVLKIALGEAVGLSGVIWGSVIAYTALATVPFFFLAHNVLGRLAAARAATG